VTAARHEVATGHDVVRQIAASGTPIPPAPPVSRPDGVTSQGRPAAHRSGTGRRPARQVAGGRDGFADGAAKPSGQRRRAPRPRNVNRAA
jgi:hypothetical protein